MWHTAARAEELATPARLETSLAAVANIELFLSRYAVLLTSFMLDKHIPIKLLTKQTTASAVNVDSSLLNAF